MRQHAEAFEPGLFRNDRQAAVKQSDIAAKFVDDEALEERLLGGRQQCPGADQAGNHAAPVDIGDQKHRHIRGQGEPHIGNIVFAEIDLGGAAGAFDDDKIGLIFKDREAFQNLRHQALLEGLKFAGAVIAAHLAQHHQLGADIRLRLQQDWIHIHRWRRAAGPGLQRLGAADLAAARGHGGVVGHVLRLERAHPVAAPQKRPAQPGGQQRFAHVGAGALQHDGLGRHALRTRYRPGL